jgi:tRNA threonylcarbamoyladenosine biosynthesis protein TsaB
MAEHAGAVLVGSGARMVADAAAGRLTIAGTARFPAIATVARIGALRPAPERAPGPLYLRAADAKPQEGFRIARAPAAAP